MPLDRFLLARVGADLGLPREWQAMVPRANVLWDCQWLLRQVRRQLLVSTPPARAGLRAWLDRERAHPTPPIPPGQLRRSLYDAVLYFGDESLIGPILDALEIVPPCVREVVLDEVVFLGVGHSTRGWTGSSRFVDRDGATRPRLIVLSGAAPHAAELVHTVLHEIGHVWTLRRPIIAVTAQGEVAVRALAQRDDAVEERLADALAYCWLAG